MSELIQILPKILFYIIIGFCYTKTYMYVRIIESSNRSASDSIIHYLIIGFAIKSIFGLIPYTINYVVDNIIICICSIIIAYFAARFVSSNWLAKWLYKHDILQVPDKYIWESIEDDQYSTFIKATNDKGYTIQGLLVRTETFERFPIIQVAYYKLSRDGVVIYDHTKEPEWTMLLDTSKYDMIQYIYNKDSKKIETWKK